MSDEAPLQIGEGADATPTETTENQTTDDALDLNEEQADTPTDNTADETPTDEAQEDAEGGD